MIPVTQTKVVVKNSKGEWVIRGNCYAAAIASMLEVPITEVPNVETLFDIGGTLWAEVMHAFLTHNGWELMTNEDFRVFHDDNHGAELGQRGAMLDYCKDKYYFVSGDTIRGIKHICIYKNGELVHDPHPTKEGLVTLEIFEELIKPTNP
jgi:hypothetical protein